MVISNLNFIKSLNFIFFSNSKVELNLIGLIDFPDVHRMELNDVVDFIYNFEFTQETAFAHYTRPLAISVSYLLVVLILKLLMNMKQTPFSLHYVSLIHNINMTLLSLAMFLGLIYTLVEQYLKVGNFFEFFQLMLCDSNKELTLKGPIYFICYVFYVSKFYELFDTVLIILKKKPLIFLHVYHHFITL